MRFEAPSLLAAVLSLVAFLMSGLAPALAEDIVYVFGDGGTVEVHRGTVVSVTDGTVRFRTGEGNERVFASQDVANVVRDASSVGHGEFSGSHDPSRPGRGLGRKLPVAFHGYAGFGTQSLGEVNRTIEEDEEILNDLGAGVDFDTFGGAPEFGLGLSFQASRKLSVGLDVGRQTSQVEIAYENELFSALNTLVLRVLEITGTVEYQLPQVVGLSVGGTAGIGIGNAEQESHLQDFTDPANDEDSFSDWDGTGFAGGVFLGYHHPMSHRVRLFARTGYRSRSLGTFWGMTESPQLGDGPTEPVDNAGKPVDFDFSGAYARVGLSFFVRQ